MSTCPSDEELRRYLDRNDSALGADRRREIEAHVERCAGCQELLERWVSELEAGLRCSNGSLPAVPATGVEGARPLGIAVPGYDVVSRLGGGGMATVYLARDLSPLKRLVALKVFRADRVANPAHRHRLLAEAEAVARLSHPHIVQIFEVREWRSPGSDTPQPYLALEYLSGGSFERVLEEREALEPAEAARLVAVLAHAVHAAHQAGVVHRDLKPSNVLLAPLVPGSPDNFPFGFPKVADFGLARRLDCEMRLTADENIVGSPDCMAPEQAEGRHDIGPAADVWALGVILYRCLTGRRPFADSSVMATLDLIRHATPAPPRAVRGAVPEALEAVCLRCLAKDPAGRYPSAAALADALRRFLQGEMVVAPPRKPAPAGSRRGWRHGLAAAALLALAGVALGFALGGWGPGSSAQQKVVSGPAPPGAETSTPTNPAPVKVLRLDVEHMPRVGEREYNPNALGLLGERSFMARTGDDVTVRAELSEPAYAYLIAFRPDGVVEVCDPDDPDASPLKTRELRYPPELKPGEVYRLDNGAGLYAFAVVASRTPLPSYREWQGRQGALPWRGGRPGTPGIVWWYNSGRLAPLTAVGLGTQRGKGEEVRGGGESVAALAKWLCALPGVEAVAVKAFTVAPAPGP
jgi:tRNA A-37 threonylcarbamoyl transferase component Bud32